MRCGHANPWPTNQNSLPTLSPVIDLSVDSNGTGAQALLSSLLRDVSRSFYLTLRVLPRRIRPQIGLAYLLARTTDTIADTGLVPLEQRLSALQSLRERILGAPPGPVSLAELAPHQGLPAERVLLERTEESLTILRAMDSADRQRVQEVLEIIISGQELDLRRFAGASEARIIALQTPGDLDDYTYRVAGCVGEFWTKMCQTHLFPRAVLPEAEFQEKGVRFGKGLQLINVLRDLPEDLRQGRCYLPAEDLKACGLTPGALLQPENEERLRPCYNRYLELAEAHLRAGWDYTNMIPRGFVRVRLACAWPLLIGKETLGLLRSGRILAPHRRIKVTRRQVRTLIWRSVLYYPWSAKWRGLFPGAGAVPAQ